MGAGNIIGKVWVSILVIFLVMFPKGGLKIGAIPITWGYLLIALSAAGFFVVRLATGRLRFASSYCIAFACSIPFLIIATWTIVENGSAEPAWTAALYVTTLVVPFSLLILSGSFFNSHPLLPFALNVIAKCCLLAAVYGLALFFLWKTTGHSFEVRYLTVNGSEENVLESKNNNRGNIQKLISTYNNGNLYGICTLMLFPMFCAIERNIIKQCVIRAALVLTLSRTVWIGLLVAEGLMFFWWHRKDPWRIVLLVVGLAVGGFALVEVIHRMGRGLDWLYDPNLGGRSEQIDRFSKMEFLSSAPFAGFGEVVYASVASSFGLLGLAAFLVFLTSPFWISLRRFTRFDPVQQAAVMGCVTYMVIACSDGAYLYIPVTMLYWILAGVILSRSFPVVRQVREKRAAANERYRWAAAAVPAR